MKRLLAIAAAVLILAGCAAIPDSPESSDKPESAGSGLTETNGPADNETAGPADDEIPEPPVDETPEPPVDETPEPPDTTGQPTPPAPEVTPPPSPAPDPPAKDNNEPVGSMYTWGQLMAMDNNNFGCPHSGAVDEKKRPLVSIRYEAKYEKYNAHFIAPDDGKIYLTYTMGYEHTVVENGQTIRLTERILDIMKEKNVKGVFLINKYYAKSCPDIVRRIIEEGHIVGNHSAGHYTLADLRIDRVVEEIMDLHNYVLDNFGYKMTIFRPPSGESSERVLAIAQSLGYTTVNYSFAYYDWVTSDQPDVQSSLQKLIDNAHSGAIYQLHCVSYTNAQILGDAIDAIREKGLEFALYS
ncbi:MAG: polysaccharide deacetylase family protein [Oscillospiraceae bacterium]|nr:polysaccharide deacetylase family protein [Oscillospiraceae bacterium]